MSNDVTRGVWVLDTPGPSVLWRGNIRVEAMTWADVMDANQTLIIQNSLGAEVFSFTSPGPGFYNFFKLMWGANGLILAQMESGKLYLSIN